MSRKIWIRLVFLIWLALVIAVSISPLSFKLKLHTVGTFHDLGHYVVYTMTGILLWVVASRWYGRIVAFVFGIALAYGQEWAENRIYHQGFEWKDVGTDLAGLVSGYAFMLLIVALTMDESARHRY